MMSKNPLGGHLAKWPLRKRVLPRNPAAEERVRNVKNRQRRDTNSTCSFCEASTCSNTGCRYGQAEFEIQIRIRYMIYVVFGA